MYVCMSAYLVGLMQVPVELVDVILARWCWCCLSRWPQKLWHIPPPNQSTNNPTLFSSIFLVIDMYVDSKLTIGMMCM